MAKGGRAAARVRRDGERAVHTGAAFAEAFEGAASAAQAAALALIDRRSGGQRLVETLAMHLLLHGNG